MNNTAAICLYETMRMVNGNIPLLPLHLERISRGMHLLEFSNPPVPDNIAQSINEKNARIRITVCKDKAGYTIESTKLIQFKATELIIDVCPEARKIVNSFSYLKSSDNLPFLTGIEYARQNNLDDCIILNQYERIAESTIANLFIVKDKTLITPPLSEGCVEGVMRKCLMNSAKSYKIIEQPITIKDALAADELFLTNAVRGIRSVKQFRDKFYGNTLTMEINDRFVKTIWE